MHAPGILTNANLICADYTLVYKKEKKKKKILTHKTKNKQNKKGQKYIVNKAVQAYIHNFYLFI